MTHEELLAMIKPMTNNDAIFMKDALRAVVGLHKPDQPDSPNDYENCVECSGNGYLAMYPCPTIQAIDKELE